MISRRQSGLWLVMGLGLLAPAACSAQAVDRGGSHGNTGGTAAASGNSGLAAFGGQTFGSGGSGNNGQGGIDACQAQSEPALLTPVNIIFIIDRSGSMGKQDTNQDGIIDETIGEWDHLDVRWNPVRDAMIAFLQNPGALGLEASLTFFPDGGQPTKPHTGVCDELHYSTPDVALQSLDDPTASQILVTKLNGIVPAGGTPTLPAVSGALTYAAKTMTDSPGSKAVVVLVTDGEPGVAALENNVIVNEKCFCYGDPGCPDEDEIPYVVSAVHQAAIAAQPILTYVIGMGEVDTSNMDMIAAAGGTEHAFIVTTGDPTQTQAEFTAALGNIRTVRAPCNIQMPAPPTNEQFDKLKVNVNFVDGNGVSHPLYYAGGLASSLGGTQLTCPDASASNPWYWTYDNEENPTQIILCASACSQTEGDANGHVDIAYGCATNVDVH